MLVSYIVPLYNKREFIIEALESMLGEDGDDVEIEICVVDDGSTDGSAELVAEYIASKSLSSIKLHVFPANRGKVAATNVAYTMASGDFIALMGADDVVVAGRTRTMLDEAHRSRLSVYGECVARTSANGPDIRRYGVPAPSLERIAIQNHYGGGCSLLWRSDAEAIFPIPASLRFEDWWIAYWLVRNRRVSVIHEIVSIYRIHGANDCGVLEETVESVRRDMGRHYAYYDAFDSIASSDGEKRFLRRGRLLRDAVFGKARLRDVLCAPFDKTSVQVAIIVVLGLGSYLRLLKVKQSFLSFFRGSSAADARA